MIEITDELTSVSAGTSEIPWSTGDAAAAAHAKRAARAPTGARVTVEFQRNAALPPDSLVRVRYEFESGRMRELIGLPQPTRTVVRQGHGVVHHYRLSQWISPAALLKFTTATVRYRTEGLESALQDSA